jgi:hypothetical protein
MVTCVMEAPEIFDLEDGCEVSAVITPSRGRSSGRSSSAGLVPARSARAAIARRKTLHVL